MKYLIVSGGDTDKEFLLELVKNGGFDVVIAADAGMNTLYAAGIEPDIAVGDFDSADAAVLERLRRDEQVEICELDTHKDDTDTEHAIYEAIRRGAREIVLVGAFGTRLDHVLANIGLLGIGLEEHVDIRLLDRHNRIRMIAEPLVIKKEEQYGKYLSLLPFSQEVSHVTLRGVKYPLDDASLVPCCSLGVSNEIVADEAEISFSQGRLLVMETKDF